MYFQIVKNAIIIIGAILLLVSLFQLQQLMRHLPEGSLKKKWYILSILIVIFIIGYVVFLVVEWNAFNDPSCLIVPFIFFFGAVFVLLTSSLAMQTARDLLRISRLERENVTDPLTHIYNRRHFDRRLADEINRAHRYGSPLVLFMVDVDHFKKINDKYGHDVGDKVLKKISSLLQKNVRNTDVIARYGGEEIAIIAPETKIEVASILGERLREAIETEILVRANNKHDDIRATVSIGIAELGKDIHQNDQFVKCADTALYKAKESGRNRVIHC